MNTFAQELKELIEKHRDMPGTILADLIDDLESAVEALVEEVNANGMNFAGTGF